MSLKNNLIEILSIQSYSYNQEKMFEYIKYKLTAIGCSYYVYNDCIYATKGDAEIYPCIASHMDTVHKICEDLTVIEVDGNLTGFNKVRMQQTGIGGDDKVGIFIALECLESFDNIKAVFFRDEETGCEGSYDPDFAFFHNCSFVLQCDRKGNKDFIDNAGGVKLSGKGFKRDIQPILSEYGYSFTDGMMTDVMALKEMGIQCAMANISCGYYNPHTPNEYINYSDVIMCLEMVMDIIEAMGSNKYICKYVYKQPVYTDWKQYSSKNVAKFNKIDNDFFSSKAVTKKKVYCECCNENNATEYVSEYNMEMCNTCIEAYVVPYSYYK